MVLDSADFLAGLKVGLEIHQQIGRPGDTKLFCRCPAEIIEREPDLVVRRFLRASAGETGIVDVAARAEAEKSKSFLYHAVRESTCMVELDEEPPHSANLQTIITALMIANACKSTVLPRMQFMRKTIVDGSATSGFQRTGLLAFGGVVPGCDPDVRIQSICVEEDAAKLVSRTHDLDIFNLTRLGIPLIEIATEPDIKTPEQAQEVASQIGMLLRSTKRVKRGLGTIRQDLNISVPRGTRVEIKGCQDLRMVPTIIRYEAQRQNGLADVVQEMEKRKISSSSLQSAKRADVSESFAKSGVAFIKKSLAKHDRAIGVRLPNMGGLLGMELAPGYRVGSELADLARSRGFGGLIHSDEDLKKYGVDEHEAQIRSLLSCQTNDAFLILLGDPAIIEESLSRDILPRVVAFLNGVPKEVRKANADGTTSYLRPLPGGARMYPETDIPIVTITNHDVPPLKLLSEQVDELSKNTGISVDQARLLVKEGFDLQEYLDRFPTLEAPFLATALLTYGKEIEARYKKTLDHIPLLEPLFLACHEGKIPRDAIFQILVEIAEGKISMASVDFSKYSQMPDEELRAIVLEAVVSSPDARPNALMGVIMTKARGRVDGKRVMAMLAEVRR